MGTKARAGYTRLKHACEVSCNLLWQRPKIAATVLESLAKDCLHRLDFPRRHTWCIVAATLTASSGLIMKDGLAMVMEGAGGLGGGAGDGLAMV